jgi:FkbM family methyltransferase
LHAFATGGEADVVKTIKLTFTACLTALVCLTYLYVFQYDRFYWLYRCHRYAPAIAACYNKKPFQFSVDFFFGAWEKPILHFMRDVMNASQDKQKIFVDVGANVGQHSMFMSRYSTAVHAFEPYEPVLKRFRSMIESNRITNIIVHPVGLGNAYSKMKFYKPPQMNTGTGSFVEGFLAGNSPYDELEIVRGEDALEKASAAAVTLIKVDIEGFEKPALEGLRRVIENSRPVVVFEMTLARSNSFAFKNREELQAAFPKDYAFMIFREPYAVTTGAYELLALDDALNFTQETQLDVVAYPVEKARQIPLQ